MAAAKRLREMAARMRDHTPALKVFGQEIDKATSDAFQQQREIGGDAWPDLASSTVEARLRGHKPANRRTRKGEFTEKAKGLRARLTAPGGMKMLQITRQMANSARTTVAGKNKLVWSALGRLLPHMTGSKGVLGHLPKRNPTVWDVNSQGKPELKPPFKQRLREVVDSYIRTGKVAS